MRDDAVNKARDRRNGNQRLEGEAAGGGRAAEPSEESAAGAKDATSVASIRDLAARGPSASSDAAGAYTLTAKGRDRERKRIAQELHDGVLHSLVAIKLGLEGLIRRAEQKQSGRTRADGAMYVELQELAQQVRESINEIRAITADLLPPRLDGVDCVEALHQCIDVFSARHPAQIRRRLESPAQPLNAAQKLNLFRILQEALANVAKHSEATRVEIELKHIDETLVLRVRDNGRGLVSRDTEGRRGQGLSNMKNRAAVLGGSVSIQSTPDSGMEVSVEIPLAEG